MKGELAMPKQSEEIPTANFYFRDKGKVQPSGFDGLGVNEEATIIIKGRITSMSVDDRWDPGKRFAVEISNCEIVQPAGQATGIEEALNTAKKTRRQVK